MKSYTDIEQSKTLSKILPLESADMWYQYIGRSIMHEKPIYFPMVIRDNESDEDIPCWSVSALLNALPKIHTLKPILDLEENSILYSGTNLDVTADNIVDACVAMIEKLHELNLL